MQTSIGKLLSSVATGLVALTVCASASAALVTSRAGLAGTDFIDWAQLGGDLASVTEPAAVTTNLGLSASVSNPNGDLERRNQGTSWSGNFDSGDKLLFTQFAPGPISIDFTVSLSAIGAQIQRNAFGLFNAVITVFDSSDVLLESYTVGGNSTPDGDNSAIFVGISRVQGDIGRVDFNVENLADFAINRVDLRIGNNNGGNVPEPSTLALLGLALAGGALTSRRKARSR